MDYFTIIRKNYLKSVIAWYRKKYTLSIPSIVTKYNIPRTGVIHIGANEGQEAGIYDDLGFKDVLWIEGYAPFYKKLESMISNRPNQRAILSFVSDVTEDVKFTVTDNKGSSSLMEYTREFDEFIPVSDEIQTVRRLDKLLDGENENFNHIKFMVLDIEGYELKALKGMGKYLKKLDWALIEISITKNFEDGPLLPDIDNIMHDNGFVRRQTWTGHFSGDSLYQRINSLSPVHILGNKFSGKWLLFLYKIGFFTLKVKLRQFIDEKKK